MSTDQENTSEPVEEGRMSYPAFGCDISDYFCFAVKGESNKSTSSEQKTTYQFGWDSPTAFE